MALQTVPMFMPGTGGPLEIGLILLIAILLFGANKIPKLARSTGEAIGEFQKGREEVEQELEDIREGPSSTTSGSSAEMEASTPDSATSTDTTETTAEQESQTATDTEAETQE